MQISIDTSNVNMIDEDIQIANGKLAFINTRKARTLNNMLTMLKISMNTRPFII